MTAGLLAAACAPTPAGPSPTDPLPTTTTTVPPTTTTVDIQTTVHSLEACLAEQGFPVEPILIDSSGRPLVEPLLADLSLTDPAAVEALGECAHHLSGGALDLSGEPLLRARVVGLLQEFAECMRSLGVDEFPDPVADFAGVGSPYPADQVPYDHPGLSAAGEACRQQLLAP